MPSAAANLAPRTPTRHCPLSRPLPAQPPTCLLGQSQLPQAMHASKVSKEELSQGPDVAGAHAQGRRLQQGELSKALM